MTQEEIYRKALELIVNSEEHEGDSFVCDFQTLQGVARQALADKPSNKFSTPDCPDCACVQDGQCLCTPSKPPAGMELTNEEIARHLGYSDVSAILNGHTPLPKDIIDDVRKVISADHFAKQAAALIEPKDQHPMQPVVLVKGIARFKANPIVEHLLDNGGIDMNALARKGFSREDREHFAQLIGYSVGGFSTLSYASDAICDKAIEAANNLMANQEKGHAE